MCDQARISVSASGKIILHGEHSVVHGKKAIACAIGSRVTVTASYAVEDDAKITILMTSLHEKDVEISIEKFKKEVQDVKPDEDLIAAIEKFSTNSLPAESNNFMRLAVSCLLFAFYKVFCITESSSKHPSVSLHIESQLPIGAGLGSSAAFNTSIACTFLVISGEVSMPRTNSDFCSITDENDLKKVNHLSYQMEKIVHKTPSGIDNSISTFGGAVSFQNGVIEKIQKMPELNLLIVDTQVPRSTKTLLSGVKEFLDRFPDIVNPILEAMHNITISAQKLLEGIYDDPENSQLMTDLTKLIVTNQHLLSSIGVSHPALDKICCIAQKYNFPAKLTGAGGGGCAFILLNGNDSDENIEKMKEELESEGFICRVAALGGPGVLVKHLNSGESGQ